MEREHGELGLGSPIFEKPPLSALAKSLTAAESQDLQEVLQRIWELADGNVGVAKMRMDLLHAHGVAREHFDGLPDVVVTIFDKVANGLVKGLSADLARAHLGIKAVVVYTLMYRHCSGLRDIKFKWLALALMQEGSTESCVIKDVLWATGGLLVTEMANGFPVSYCNENFEAYVIDGHNPLLRELERDMSKSPVISTILQAWDVEDQRSIEKSGEVGRAIVPTNA